ncbi:helix-turn-helix transcriptional regulator [Amycolatopsis nigrescens]|uniref:helix-turn-helix transcriptional regulator n=1 Tax=Amycolatopsis nigrescens TaxID=381445 RepID=UPI00058D5115|nr:AraC family transcriptional regulator [Amycolatopsis nigrescens]
MLLQPAVRQAISAMHARYFDSITLTEIAAEVFVSPFHFSRVFAKATGVTPGRYLTAIRLFEAKRLLLTTKLTVSDIVCSVGYSSVGTFTSRFTRAVGMTPTQYRDPEVDRLLLAVAPGFQRLPPLPVLRSLGKTCASPRADGGVITGRIEMPRAASPANVLVGVFAEAIPQCGPIAFTGQMDVGSTDFTIYGVPDGNWVVKAVAEHSAGTTAASFSVGTVRHPVQVRAGGRSGIRLRMRAPHPTDPPIAITLASLPSPHSNRVLAQRRRAGLRAVA